MTRKPPRSAALAPRTRLPRRTSPTSLHLEDLRLFPPAPHATQLAELSPSISVRQLAGLDCSRHRSGAHARAALVAVRSKPLLHSPRCEGQVF